MVNIAVTFGTVATAGRSCVFSAVKFFCLSSMARFIAPLLCDVDPSPLRRRYRPNRSKVAT
jgi:hypothetical protein